MQSTASSQHNTVIRPSIQVRSNKVKENTDSMFEIILSMRRINQSLLQGTLPANIPPKRQEQAPATTYGLRVTIHGWIQMVQLSLNLHPLSKIDRALAWVSAWRPPSFSQTRQATPAEFPTRRLTLDKAGPILLGRIFGQTLALKELLLKHEKR
ncbi:hypothetical protein FQN53_000474 [Emmonsiellopsis sp. PD_33]|nr:hypothetical protein FQN53_000474 [Emmonsiellopsis sp. PD_33]